MTDSLPTEELDRCSAFKGSSYPLPMAACNVYLAVESANEARHRRLSTRFFVELGGDDDRTRPDTPRDA